MLNISRENLVFLLRVKFRSSSESFKLTDRFRLKVEPVLFPNECKIKCRVLIPCRMESEVIRVDLLHLLRHMSRCHVSCLMSHVSCLMFQCWWMWFCCLSYRRRSQRLVMRVSAECWVSYPQKKMKASHLISSRQSLVYLDHNRKPFGSDAQSVWRKSGSICLFSLFPFCPFLVPVVVIHVKSHDAAEHVHMTTIIWCEVFKWFCQLERDDKNITHRDVSAGQVVLMWDLFLHVMNINRI